MASEQITNTKTHPDDVDVLKYKAKQLKEYIINNGGDPSKLVNKTELQWRALDVRKWTRSRLQCLDSKFRPMLLDKIPSIDPKKREIFMNSNDNKQRDEIISEMLSLLPSDPIESIDVDKTDQLALATMSSVNKNDENDSMSSVSTHDSMPSLMSDDESDDDEDESDDDDDESDLDVDQNEAIKSIEAPKKQNVPTKKTKGGKDDFLKGLKGAFLNKDKKGKKKENKKKMNKETKGKKEMKKKETKQSNVDKVQHNKNTKNAKNTKNDKTEKKINENKQKKQEIKKEKEEEEETKGYHLQHEIEANKNANGQYFLCIGPRKLFRKISEHTTMDYITCYVSLKHKLKKKGKKPRYYKSIMINMISITPKQREIEREKLKRPFENVVSFDVHRGCNVLDITQDKEDHLTLYEAFLNYQENGKYVNIGLREKEEIKKAKEAARKEKEAAKKREKEAKRKKEEEKRKKEEEKRRRDEEKRKKDEEKRKKEEENRAKEEALKHTQILGEQVNVEQQLAHDQLADIESKLAALSMKNDKTNHEEKQDDTAYITTQLMNLCRLNKSDIMSMMDDTSMDQVIKGLYVRGPSQHGYKVYQIQKTVLQNNTKYIMIHYGSKKLPIKAIKVSNDPFTDKEVNQWKQRMRKDNVLLPTQEVLMDAAETLKMIGESLALKKEQKHTVHTEPEPGMSLNTAPLSPPQSAPSSHMISSSFQNAFHSSSHGNYAPLNSRNLARLAQQPTNQRNMFLTQYNSAIDEGANCFWMIPTPDGSDGDSRYIAFLLMKTSKNDDNLQTAAQFAQNIRNDVILSEIREWTQRDDEKKKGHWKSKGWLIDCKDSSSAYQIMLKLQDFLPSTFGHEKPCNFCRLVLQSFGDAYMKPRRKPQKGIKNKPQGPQFNYKEGEPSIVSMEENPHKVTFIPGEASMCGDDTQSVTSMASMTSVNTTMTNQTVSKYDEYSHMVFQNAPQYQINDRVSYHGQEYSVLWVGNDGKVRIENDNDSEIVSVHAIQHVH